MTSSDREHFDSYRLQTRVKHAILEGYLPSYFNVIKQRHENLLFIDGFAGRGHYTSEGESFPGSPMRALEIVASSPNFSKKVLCILIEKRADFYDELRASAEEFYRAHPQIKEPVVVNGTFSEQIDELLRDVGGGQNLAPTFLFVDPCGVEDVSMRRIGDILSRDYSEVFIFFNVDGIRRIAGLAESRGVVSPVLVDLYGSKERAEATVEEFHRLSAVADRELSLVANYRLALSEVSGAKFVIPLRVESEHRAVTSHYLLHATKHDLGFKIMKDVVWSRGGGIECEGETLALQQASRRRGARLFRPDLEALDRDILDELKRGTRQVGLFRDEWVRRPEDMFSSGVYRKRLLALEADGKICVLKEDGRTPYPANKRRPYAGEPSIAEKLYVRLP